jgi:hypothetical protein
MTVRADPVIQQLLRFARKNKQQPTGTCSLIFKPALIEELQRKNPDPCYSWLQESICLFLVKWSPKIGCLVFACTYTVSTATMRRGEDCYNQKLFQRFDHIVKYIGPAGMRCTYLVCNKAKHNTMGWIEYIAMAPHVDPLMDQSFWHGLLWLCLMLVNSFVFPDFSDMFQLPTYPTNWGFSHFTQQQYRLLWLAFFFRCPCRCWKAHPHMAGTGWTRTWRRWCSNQQYIADYRPYIWQWEKMICQLTKSGRPSTILTTKNPQTQTTNHTEAMISQLNPFMTQPFILMMRNLIVTAQAMVTMMMMIQMVMITMIYWIRDKYSSSTIKIAVNMMTVMMNLLTEEWIPVTAMTCIPSSIDECPELILSWKSGVSKDSSETEDEGVTDDEEIENQGVDSNINTSKM